MISFCVGVLIGFVYGLLFACCIGAWRRKKLIERRRQEFLNELPEVNEFFLRRMKKHERGSNKDTIH